MQNMFWKSVLALCEAFSYYLGQPYVARASARHVLGAIASEGSRRVQELLVISAVPATWPVLITDLVASFQILSLQPGGTMLRP